MDEVDNTRLPEQCLQSSFPGSSLKQQIFCICILMALVCSLAKADIPDCDSGLKPIGGNLGYQWRSTSNVCEGLYEAKVSASLELVSYLVGELNFDPSVQTTLNISATADLDSEFREISIRAVALGSGTYYRMDTDFEPSSHVEWALNEVIGPAGLGSKSLGLFGWVEDKSEKIFIPLKVDSGVDQALSDERTMSLLIRPTVDIDYIKWRAWTDGREPAGDGEIQDGAKAGWPFKIPISKGPFAILNVEIQAKELNREEWLPIRLRVIRIPR